MAEQERLRPSEKQVSAGHVLCLTNDLDLLKKQLDGLRLTNVPKKDLMEFISTDEIMPNKAGMAYTGKEKGYLGKFTLTGLRGGIVEPGAIVKGNFQTIVAGASFGRGSSRIHAPLSLKEAGINLVIAEGAERIFSENCVNCGIYVVNSDTQYAQRLLKDEPVPVKDILEGVSGISRKIIEEGGLLSYFKAIERKTISIPQIDTKKRPMTIAEKIIAKKALNQNGKIGIPAVKPGDECILEPDIYYGYELQTPVVRAVLKETFGDNSPVRHREKVFLHNDHTALLKDDASATQRQEQSAWGKALGFNVYELTENGAIAICHTKMLEDHLLPGELILGNDSHTCTGGVVNALAIGKGAIDLAGAIAYDKMITTVPESIRINLRGKFNKNVTVKDLMLSLGSRPNFKKELIGSGRVFEFGGEALEEIPFDEQTKLTNMSVELLGFSGIVEPNKQLISYLGEKRGMKENEVEKLMVKSDSNAKYAQTIDIDLSEIEQTVATPGDTQNGQPLSEITKQNIRIQKAYVGSCTHGTVEDLRQAAEVLKGKKIADGVKLFIQPNSLGNLIEAKQKGYIQDLLNAGAELLPIGCGACINAGPGATGQGEVGIYATNRNFPGRTGKGEAYLASSYTVAASAIKGQICGPQDLASDDSH